MAQVVIKTGFGSITPKSFQRYDVVDILPDDISCGNEVYLNEFLVLYVNSSVESLQYLKDSEKIEANPELIISSEGSEGYSQIIKMRKWFFDFNKKLSAEEINKIRNSEDIYLVTVSVSDFEEKI